MEVLPSATEKFGKEMLELMKKYMQTNSTVNLHVINNYINNVQTFSPHDSDSDGTSAYKGLGRKLTAQKDAH